MTPQMGMDVDAVRNTAARLDQQASQLAHAIAAIDAAVAGAERAWRGHDAQNFRGAWQQQHRTALLRARESIAGLAQSARNNAADQETASGTAGGGTASARALTGLPAFGNVPTPVGNLLRNVDTVASPLGGMFSSLNAVKGIAGTAALGTVLSGFGYFTKGYTIGEEAARGKYVDAALDGGLTGLDLTADVMKKDGPVGYLAGAALQSWVEAGRAAREVDWSAQGMRALTDASASDWASAFGESLTQMPSRLGSIFSF